MWPSLLCLVFFCLTLHTLKQLPSVSMHHSNGVTLFCPHTSINIILLNTLTGMLLLKTNCYILLFWVFIFSEMLTLPIRAFCRFHNCTLSLPVGHRAPPRTQIQRWPNIHWRVEEWPLGEEDGPPGLLRRRHVCTGRRWLTRRQGRTLFAARSWDRAHLPRILWQDRWGSSGVLHTQTQYTQTQYTQAYRLEKSDHCDC